MSELLEVLKRLDAAAVRARKERQLASAVKTAERALAKAFAKQGREFLQGFARLEAQFPVSEAALVERTARRLDWERYFTAAELATLLLFEVPLSRLMQAALLIGARLAIADLKIDYSFALENPRAVAFLKDRAAARVTMINQATRSSLNTLLTKAMDDGWSYGKTAKAIREQFEGFAGRMPQKHIQSRAHLVAVQEAGEAYEHGNLAVGQELQAAGLQMEKSWLTVGDDRVSEQCQMDEAAGWIPLDDVFPSGNDCPPGHVACRCCALYQRKSDSG
ncbi:MAG: hypothetical protein JW990_07695 [Thermoleophilia bacterium]|nr:hypothetical protein [Thermoleophilia bacterium]